MYKIDNEFIKEQEKKLLLEKTRLTNELKELDIFPQYGDQDEDNADEVEDFTVAQGQGKDLLFMYKNVKDALKRIKENTYGICENCNKMIEKERLIAFPAATKCLNCENK